MTRPSVAVWKFASCDGCQLTLLDCEDELLALAGALDIAMFLEAGPADEREQYDVSLVEGSISTPHDAERIRDVRRRSRLLVTIGACATSGGIQALRNLADVDEFASTVYARPEYLEVLATSTPIADHVPVDLELRGCPISKHELLATLAALLAGRRPPVSSHSVCVDCKRAGHTCVLVAHSTPCLGPVTHAGCGALCPSFHRGCYGCFGPSESANVPGLVHGLQVAGLRTDGLERALRSFNTNAAAFAASITEEVRG